MRTRSLIVSLAVGAFLPFVTGYAQEAKVQRPHNVILFVADGLRRGSVNETDTPTLLKLRKLGVDFRNSHSVFPTFTTANASVIATGHGLGDTGDYSNTIYPGVWLTKADVPEASGYLVPFLENDEVLTNMNDTFSGNYLGERTLLGIARDKGFNVASVGKLGPTAIQAADTIGWNEIGLLSAHGAVIIDDTTGQSAGFPLPVAIAEAITKAGLATDAPLRTNGFSEASSWNNGFAGDATTSGTLASNKLQQKWFADVTTEAILPLFAAEDKPFVLVFWSRDPDGTQHNQGDSLQHVAPGINGDTARLGLRNADQSLKQLVDWLDAHPALKATTDVLVTSDHGFATISRREIASDGTQSSEPSAALTYELSGKEKPQPPETLPTGFLAIDLAIFNHMRLFDASVRSTSGPSVFAELRLGGEKSQHPSTGSALLGDPVKAVDGSDAKVIVASNGGSDLLYVPSGDPKVVQAMLDTLTQLDYVGGLFVDDGFCKQPTDCAGALPLSRIGMEGASHVPRPAIVVTYKVFNQVKGDLQSAVQVSDTTLQEGQGMHGGFGRDQT
ncbi:MAG: alkaline phosphatase family protein, partial [Acidobacteriota bacterium]|nr:alkaline phosphatase family protein [Acidobacteriota bacterium]